MGLKKQIQKMQGTAEQIEEIMTTGSGTITLGTSIYPDLNDFDPAYWQFHCPYGAPGDELHLTEDYRISSVCQDNSGYSYTMDFKNGGNPLVYKSTVSTAITPANQWIPGNQSTPDYAIRCKTLITGITVSENNWIISVALIIPTV